MSARKLSVTDVSTRILSRISARISVSWNAARPLVDVRPLVQPLVIDLLGYAILHTMDTSKTLHTSLASISIRRFLVAYNVGCDHGDGSCQ